MNAPQAITVTLNPAIDQLVTLDALLSGQVQRALGSVQAPGGKGINVAAALAGLGVSTAALGVLGRDNAGMFEALFAQRGIQTTGAGDNLAEARTAAIVAKNGVRVAYLGYTSVATQGTEAGPKKPD
mgnify:CR=1 FL=1